VDFEETEARNNCWWPVVIQPTDRKWRVGGCCVLVIEKAFDTTWPSGLIYKLLEFAASFFKLISFLIDRKFKVLVEGSSRFRPCPNILQSTYKWRPPASGTHLALFVDDTCIYATQKHKRRVLCNLQRGLTAVNSWCECWNLKLGWSISPWRRTIKWTRHFLVK
jgi:hypothetical protein